MAILFGFGGSCYCFTMDRGISWHDRGGPIVFVSYGAAVSAVRNDINQKTQDRK